MDSTRLAPPAPSLGSLAREAAGFFELPRLGLAYRALLREPRGDGSIVFVLPGFGADDRSTWPLRRFLDGLGYESRGWRRGANRADVPDAIEQVGTEAREAATATGARVSIVGWSLGGYIAREVARDHPETVRRVVTFGSPVIGGPKYTNAARLAGPLGWDLDAIEAEVEARKEVALRVPVTAIYSRRDGVVDWRACIDEEGDGPIRHVEVDASHLGLGFQPEVYRLVARSLAEPVEGA